MIQRIQSIYLLLVTVLLVVALFLPIGYFYAGALMAQTFKPLHVALVDGGFQSTWGLFVILVLSAVVSFATIFLFHNRMLQVRMAIFNICLLVGYYLACGFFVYMLKSGLGADSFRLGWGVVIPAICIILDYLAFRAIYSDEVMVRAADRLR